jgi:hypothetical protein
MKLYEVEIRCPPAGRERKTTVFQYLLFAVDTAEAEQKARAAHGPYRIDGKEQVVTEEVVESSRGYIRHRSYRV